MNIEQAKILDFIYNNGKATSDILARHLNIFEGEYKYKIKVGERRCKLEKIRKCLCSLKKNGWIKPDGYKVVDRFTHYKIWVLKNRIRAERIINKYGSFKEFAIRKAEKRVKKLGEKYAI